MRNAPGFLPEPRSFAGTAWMLGAITVLPFGPLSSWVVAASQRWWSFGQIFPFGLVAGALFGLLFGVAMACFLEGETATVEVADTRRFLAALSVATAQLGYNPASRLEDFFTYKPSFQAGWAAGRISVQIGEQRAVIVGPKLYVKKLLGRLGTA